MIHPASRLLVLTFYITTIVFATAASSSSFVEEESIIDAEEVGIIQTKKKGNGNDNDNDNDNDTIAKATTTEKDKKGKKSLKSYKDEDEKLVCVPSNYEPSVLQKPCELDAVDGGKAPSQFSILFPTQYGHFVAECVRDRAPVWVDRVYQLAKYGYYNHNYFFRVIPGKYIQFGTNGDPAVSNVYNYTTTTQPECGIVRPQPPEMPYCMEKASSTNNTCVDVPVLSNTFGTIAMSTNYNEGIPGYPNGVTWNATAELFINIGNNPHLDANLFVPICNIGQREMEDVVLQFPSFGEVADMGGTGPSLGLLYQEGNSYIEANPVWDDSMAITSTVSVCTSTTTSTATDNNNNNNNNRDSDENDNDNNNNVDSNKDSSNPATRRSLIDNIAVRIANTIENNSAYYIYDQQMNDDEA